MRNAQRAIGIVAAAAVAVVLGWAASAEEPKPAGPGSEGEGKPDTKQDDIKVRPGRGVQDMPTLEWSTRVEKIKPGAPRKLASDLLLGLYKLNVLPKGSTTWKPATAVRFKVHDGGEYTIEKEGSTYKWKACKVPDLVRCEHGPNCGGGYGVPPELMNDVTMVATFAGSDGFESIDELNLMGSKPDR